MSVALATQNPEAAARMSDPRGLPQCGDVVQYHYRPGQIFGGQSKTAAIVLASDPQNQTLRLYIIKGLDDYLLLDQVPRKVGEDHGWEFGRPALPVDVLRSLSADPPSQQHAPMEVHQLRERVEKALSDLAELTQRFDNLGIEMAAVVVGEDGGEAIDKLKVPGMSLYERLVALQKQIDGAAKGARAKR